MIETDVELTIRKRGAAPLGGGEIHFKCPVYKNLKTIQLQNSGMVKRIRGMACSIRVSPAIANRLVDSAKEVLLKFLPDVYIHTDNCRGAASGKSPGSNFEILRTEMACFYWFSLKVTKTETFAHLLESA